MLLAIISCFLEPAWLKCRMCLFSNPFSTIFFQTGHVLFMSSCLHTSCNDQTRLRWDVTLKSFSYAYCWMFLVICLFRRWWTSSESPQSCLNTFVSGWANNPKASTQHRHEVKHQCVACVCVYKSPNRIICSNVVSHQVRSSYPLLKHSLTDHQTWMRV